ncbi:endonuclease/exonuclease/phosphatase family protein [Nocardioides sp.]|uniref:endonuclease/exonuclease/phosphatase family protein n=1 Tax=Nocardioides sp. TaxID=35761 RepID=UPI002B265390|nr:endonuclease/exonuclease/phosphatase family protein [Nocardioides sp.]
MRHRFGRLDPTILLVVVLVLVVGALLGTRDWTTGPPSANLTDIGQPLPPEASAVVSSPSALPTPSGKAGSQKKGAGKKNAKKQGPQKLDIKQQGEEQCVDTSEDVELTAISYNIKSGHISSLGQLASLLRTTEADVVLLQEVDQMRYASGRVDQPAFFADQLDMAYAFGKNVPHAGGGGYGTLVLSRYPLVSAKNTFLPQPAGTQRRGLLHVVIDVAGTEVSIYNTHLQNADPSARLQQAAAMRTIVASDPRPRILGGDMNAPPGSDPMNILTSSWTDTWSQVGVGAGRTAPAGSPRARIDYLLHGGAGLTPLAADVLGVRLSDHLAVRALYRLDTGGEPICFQKLS